MSVDWNLLAILVGSFLLFSCGTEEKPIAKRLTPPPGVGPVIRSSTDTGNPVAAGSNTPAAPISTTAPEDIAWTNFEGEGIPELANLMSAPKKGPWEQSDTIARQTAAREGKPILIWFTDSARSPLCKVLSAELFATNEFGKWADQNLVRLRVDSSFSADDPNLSLDEKVNREASVRQYVRNLKKRYRVLGNPSLLMLNPSGEVIARFRGYKSGDKDFLWGLIKQNTHAAEASTKEWRKQLEAKGYREWEGKAGKSIFAKLLSYSKGKLILIEPGGERFRTDENNLSIEDKQWIEEQKTLRGIE
jgi:thioredoxin-related protein